MKIPLTRGKFALIDDENFDLIKKHKWYLDGERYAATNGKMINGKKGKNIRMHQLIMNPPDGYEVDHISRNGLDNRRFNLRICTHAENMRNAKFRKDNKKAGFIGIKWHNLAKKWQARIRIDNKEISLGYFKDKIEAALAYNNGALKYHGEFAKQNII